MLSMQQEEVRSPKTEGAMRPFAIDNGSRRSFVSLFKDVTHAKLLDNQGGDHEITPMNEEKKKSDPEIENVEEEVWAKLPMDLQMSIIQCIPPNERDYRNLRVVCRRWKAMAPPLRWISGSAAIEYPWLVSFQKEKGVYDFYDPTSDLTYHMSTESTSYLAIFASYKGWLLLSEGPQSIYMLEPFTKMRIDLPKMPQQFNLVGGQYWFGVNPTSGRYRVNQIFRRSPEQLMILEFTSKMTSCACLPVKNKSFTPSWNNLIFCDGSLFGLDQNGKFGIFATVGNERQWHVLNDSQILCFPSRVEQSFLVVLNLRIMSVFVGSSEKWVKVFNFNFSALKWEQVDSLGNLVLFVGRTSIAVESKEERMRNKIFFPIFKEADGSIMFYCLETCRFRSFSSENSNLDLHGERGFKKLVSNCTWIRPNLVPSFS
ncbi:F-box/kelch-repeat protein At1g57790-like [Rhododendron vialii]|uniref:F-box/kelch-repeat protein At1g57790-like n=1 Tax=Rhododendron vialii TaxID=182163 RepID=UPI0026601A89|nr:F-box/kelch-repeat protein At1g57790-like [Rhododendron vialii]